MNRLIDKACRYKGNKLMTAWHIAIASYVHSRSYDLTIIESTKGAIEIFYDYLKK